MMDDGINYDIMDDINDKTENNKEMKMDEDNNDDAITCSYTNITNNGVLSCSGYLSRRFIFII